MHDWPAVRNCQPAAQAKAIGKVRGAYPVLLVEDPGSFAVEIVREADRCQLYECSPTPHRFIEKLQASRRPLTEVDVDRVFHLRVEHYIVSHYKRFEHECPIYKYEIELVLNARPEWQFLHYLADAPIPQLVKDGVRIKKQMGY